MGGCPPGNHENRLSLRGARPRSKLGIMRVRLLPLRFAQGRNDTWGIYFRNKGRKYKSSHKIRAQNTEYYCSMGVSVTIRFFSNFDFYKLIRGMMK